MVASFFNQIQPDYYGRNITVSIEGFALEHFSTVPKTDIKVTKPSHQRHAVFHIFLSDYIKHDAATTTAYIKRLISLIKEKNKIDNIIDYNMVKY